MNHRQDQNRIVRLLGRNTHLDAPLPDGYSLGREAGCLLLVRADASEVAAFSELGATAEAIAREAWKDARHA